MSSRKNDSGKLKNFDLKWATTNIIINVSEIMCYKLHISALICIICTSYSWFNGLLQWI